MSENANGGMVNGEAHCLDCGATPVPWTALRCQVCGGALGFRYTQRPGVPVPSWDDQQRGMWRYWPLLPITPGAGHVTLGEGATPLHRSRLYGDRQVWLKDETRNPTGSHKDRALALSINHACAIGARVSAVVSAGSTGLSHAAYAARAGLRAITLMSADTPEERSYPVFALGTSVIKVTAPIDEVMEALIQAGTRLGIYLASTTRRSNPYQAEASKTIAYELVEALGEPPDWLVVPTGGGGTVAAVWRGFQELHGLGLVSKLPQLAAIVPRRFNALEVAFRDGIATAADYLALPTRPGASTLLTKLAHDHPPDGLEAIEAVRQSGGLVLSVTDAAASAGQMRLAQHEGLYVEPSSGVLLPALDELFAAGHAAPGQRIVGLLCGSGFRETFEVMKQIPMRSKTVDLDDLENALAET